MSSTDALLQRLQQEIDKLRDDWYAAGRGDEFEDRVARLRAHGSWPFGEQDT